MKRITIIVLSVISLLLLTCCSDIQSGSTDNGSVNVEIPEKGEIPENIEIPEDEIILVSRYINFASGYDDRGAFIDSSGGIYSFDFSQLIYPCVSDKTDASFLEKLNIIRKCVEPEIYIDTDTLQQLYNYSGKINKNAEFISENVACDAGAHQLCICDTDTHDLVVCSESGDFKGTLDDSYAKKLISFVKEKVSDQINTVTLSEKNLSNKTYYLSSNSENIFNIHCGYCENPGKYVIADKEQLKRFAEKNGIEILGSVEDEYVYFVEIENVSSTGYDLIKSGMICAGGCFEFISSPDSIYPEDDKKYGEMMDGFCFIAKFPKSIALEYRDEQNGTYNGIDGSQWIEL